MSILRALVISLAIVGVGVVLAFKFQAFEGTPAGVLNVRVVNDGQKPATVQPCWDIDCLNRIGLKETVIPPGHSRALRGYKWASDFGAQITVAVLGPGEKYPPFKNCMVADFQPHVKIGVIRVSQARPCPNVPEGGNAG